MAITKEVLNELLKEYKGPDDFYGQDDLIKQFRTKVRTRLLLKEQCKRN